MKKVNDFTKGIKKSKITWFITAFLVIAAVLFDQWCKFLAAAYLKGNEPVSLIDGVFELNYLENRGAAFGIMQDRQYFFVVCAAAICLVILYVYGRLPSDKKYTPLRACAILIWAGAVGNMIDRIRLNYVIDFFYFRLIDFPVFNVADCYVVIACVLFAVLVIFYYRDDHEFDFLMGKKG